VSKAAKRAILAAALATAGLVIVLWLAGAVAAAPATSAAPGSSAAPGPSSATSSPAGATAALGGSAPVYGWVIQLRGAISRDLTYTQFAALQKSVGARWTDASHDTWAGIPLWRLVGLVDDKNPKTFNSSLAAKGYSVQVVGLDGFTATLLSTDKSWVHSKTAIVADEMDGAPLSFGSMSTSDPGTWLPSWPAQLVGPALQGSQQPGGIVKIIVYKHGVTPPAKPAALSSWRPSWIVQVRGASGVDLTAAQFRKLATAHGATWTDTGVTPSVVYAGVPLWRLVALADGGSPATLNLDRLGLHWKDNPGYSDYDGYKVDVYGMGVGALGADAPTVATFPASAIASKSSVVIADRQDGKQLTPTQGATVQLPDSSYAWRPTWPARVVGAGVAADQASGGVVRVVLEKPVVPSYLTPLVLKGRRTVKIAYLNFPTPVTWDGTKAGNINPSLRALYRGQTISKLIGLVDDNNPTSFNVKLARKGYKIEFIASDGYTWSIRSQTIIGQKHWIVASLKNGAVMLSNEGPYRFVGSFIKPFYGKQSVFKLIKIKLIF
jgi:hypothetical protein